MLDPTCGSGAFLFAALNILRTALRSLPGPHAKPGRIERDQRSMRASRTQNGGVTQPTRTDSAPSLSEVEQHPNRDYFILQIHHRQQPLRRGHHGGGHRNLQIAPLPQACRPGRKVQRHRTPTRHRFQYPRRQHAGRLRIARGDAKSLAGQNGWQRHRARFKRLSRSIYLRRSYGAYRAEGAGNRTRLRQFPSHPDRVQARCGRTWQPTSSAFARCCKELGAELDGYLASEYGIDRNNIIQKDVYEEKLKHWQESHQPFHWWIEFYGIMKKGGFDVIIGNPPYVSVRNIDYTLLLHGNTSFTDLYAYVILRSLELSILHGHIGMIVPLSITFSEDFGLLRNIVSSTGQTWFSSYDNIPAALFAGVSQRCTIWLNAKSSQTLTFVAPMYRWRSEYRKFLTSIVSYTRIENYGFEQFGIPKLASLKQFQVLKHINNTHELPSRLFSQKDRYSKVKLGFSQSARNFVSVFLEIHHVWMNKR